MGACALGLTAMVPSLFRASPAQAAADYPPTTGQMQEFVLLKQRAPAPVTPFLDGDGGMHHFTDFTGKVLLVNFWATWCAPCIEEMPSLARLNDQLAGPNFQLLTISQDRGGKSVAEPFLRERLGLPNLDLFFDPKLKLGRELGLRGLPSTYLIDQQGRLVGGMAGSAEWDSPEAVEMIKFVMLQGDEMEKTEGNSST
jgi:thiol-disulfide isomerase/thioredoxin